MPEVTYNSKTFEVDEDGFLCNFADFGPEWIEYVQKSEGILEIVDAHHQIITFLQEYYQRNGIAPMVRAICKNTGFKLKEIYELFPSGPGRGACRMAGLPKPTGCV